MDSNEELRDPLVDPPGSGFVRTGLFFYGAMAIAAVLWRVGLYQERIFFATVPGDGVAWPHDLVLGLAVGGAIVLVSNLLTQGTQWGEKLAKAMAEALGPLSTPDAILLAFASGLAEEMFFRGALQPRVGFVVASLLFGVIHFVPRRVFYPWTIFAVLAGFIFGWLFESTGNLLAPVAAHTLVNGVNLPILVRKYGSQSPTPPS